MFLHQVKIWFQNRRNKWKRQLAAELEAANLQHAAHRLTVRVPVPVIYSDNPGMAGNSSVPVSVSAAGSLTTSSLQHSGCGHAAQQSIYYSHHPHHHPPPPPHSLLTHQVHPQPPPPPPPPPNSQPSSSASQ